LKERNQDVLAEGGNGADKNRGCPVLGGPKCDILVLEVRSVDLFQDVHSQLDYFLMNFEFSQKLLCARQVPAAMANNKLTFGR
jgi:hypothetical protein